MATSGITAIGTTVSWNETVIPELKAPVPGSRKATIHPVLTCDSTSGYADKIVGAFDAGQVTLAFIYNPASTSVYSQLQTDFAAKTKATLLVTHPTGSNMSGQAVIADLGDPGSSEADGVEEFTVTFERCGAHTHTGV